MQVWSGRSDDLEGVRNGETMLEGVRNVMEGLSVETMERRVRRRYSPGLLLNTTKFSATGYDEGIFSLFGQLFLRTTTRPTRRYCVWC